MRRKEREIAEFNDKISILEKCNVVHLAMSDGNTPYIVPLNFGFTAENGELTLYFHTALEGKKLDIIKKNPVVCFEAECSLEIIKAETPCGWTAHFESVAGLGKAELLENTQEKQAAMTAIMRHYGFEGEALYNDEILKKTCIIKLKADKITGKRNQ